MKLFVFLLILCCMFIIYGYIGAWSINYIVIFFGGKAINAIAAWILGLLFGETTIPFAILLWIINLF